MSQFDLKKNSVAPDQIYFDLTVTNFKSTLKPPTPVYYNDQRSMPFIMNPEDYYLSILRFTVETGTIPVFIPSIEPNQANKDLTIYNITLQYTDPTLPNAPFTATLPIIWRPQDQSAGVPAAPNATFNKLQDNASGYYFAYHMTWFVLLINETLQLVYAALDALVVAAALTLPSFFAPVCYYDTTSSTIVLYADVLGYKVDLDPLLPNNEIQMIWNAPLYGLFSSLPAILLGYGSQLNWRIGFINFGSTNLQEIIVSPVPVPPIPAFFSAIVVYQEISTLANITPVTAIVFTSNTLPIQASQVSTPVFLNEGQQVSLGGNNSDIANILTDLASDTGEYRPNLVYVPTSQYRLITLYGNRPLYNIDIEIFYRLKTGQLIPFRLASGQAATLKIGFLKKDKADIQEVREKRGVY
jgi:hypothetical protein